MNTGRILTDVHRELLRPGTLKLIAGYLLLVSFLALMGSLEGAMDLPLELGYYLVPLFMSPYAAQRVLADREEGMAEVLATTPLTRAEKLTAQVVSILLVPVVGITVTLPILYALSAQTAPGAFWTMLVHVPWALAIASASASVGLVIGHLTPERPRLGLGVAFAVVILWFILGVNLNDITSAGPVVSLLSKSSPFTYVDLAGPLGPIPAGPLSMLVGPLLLTGITLLALIPIASYLQNFLGWDTPLSGHPVAALTLAGTLVAGGGILAVWEIPENPWGQQPGYPVEATRAGFGWSISLALGEEPGKLWTGGWGQDTPIRLMVTIIGQPNATVSINGLSLTSDKIDFEPTEPVPGTVRLDSTTDEPPDNAPAHVEEAAGIGTIRLHWSATPTQLFQTASVALDLRVDGEPVHFDLTQSALKWRVSLGFVAAGSLVSMLPVIAVARWMPRRWNRW